jgi:hypothetical protein
VVATLTVLSTSAATSVKNFLCAIDNFYPPLTYRIALQLYIFEFPINTKLVFHTTRLQLLPGKFSRKTTTSSVKHELWLAAFASWRKRQYE